MSPNAAANESTGGRKVEVVGSTGLVLQNTYTLGACIGSGGTGEVYEATHVRLPGRVAVKILRAHLLKNEDAFARFCREAEIMSALQHPHILQIFDFNTALDGRPYFVMEYLEGVDLETRLANSGALPLPALVRIVEAVASALGAAHAAGIVHRELKPANIFLMRGEGQDDDFVKVIDFGISTVDQIDARTDQFALAAIAYTMLTGREPFVGVVHAQPLPLAHFLPWDTSEIQSVLDRALARRPEDRFDGIVQFAWALGAAARSAIRGENRTRAPVSPAPLQVVPVLPARRPLLDDRPPFEADLPRSLDRVPHGSARTVALGLVVMGLTAVIVQQGWYRGLPGRTASLARNLVSLARGERRAPPADVQAPTPEATDFVPRPREVAPPPNLPPPVEVPPPPREPGSDTVAVVDELPPRVEERSAGRPAGARPRARRAHHRAVSRSGWQTIDLPPPMAPDGFSIQEPEPTPPARDLAPAPASSD
jgi:serine/threonine-protein kinase